MLRTAFECHAAFVISGVAFKVLVAGARLDMELVRRVVLLRDIPDYSEFLLAFPLALIGGTVALPLVKLPPGISKAWCLPVQPVWRPR